MVKCFPIALIALSLAAPAGAQDADATLRAAQRAETAGDTLNAFFLYGRAAVDSPADGIAALRGQALGARLLQTAVTSVGIDTARDMETRMANRIAVEQISPSDAIEGVAALPPPRLKPSTERQKFDIRGTARPVIEQVARSFGIKTIFEPDFQSPATITFQTGELTRDEAFRSLEAVTNTFFVPVNEDTMMVFPDTTDKRNNNSAVMSAIVPITTRFSVQEAQELASGIQQILELRHIAVDAGRHVIFLRDQEYKVLAARRLITDLMRYRAQVSIEVELLSVAKTSTLGLGLTLPNAANILNLRGASILPRLADVGLSWFGMGIADAGAFATLSRGSTQSSLRTQMVSLDGQQAMLHIGDRYPVISGISGFGSTSVPIVQFQDLGLKLQITPVVHAGGEMTLTIEADYSVLGTATNNGIPIISSRKFNGTVRTRSTEWAVIAGLAASQHTVTSNGIAGLGEIPAIGHLFRRETTIDDTNEILVLVKPRLISEPVWEQPMESFWIGSETKPPTYY